VSNLIEPAHDIGDPEYIAHCKAQLDAVGALVLQGFFNDSAIEQVVANALQQQDQVFYAGSTHNVYLTDPDPELGDDHVFNRQVESSKGLIADDQIPADSPLRDLYDDVAFRSFIAGVVGIETVFPYADDLSSINVHFADEGRELGWHFDNSAFAVTMLLQAPTGGGVFEYVPAVRDADAGDMAFARVKSVLEGDEPVQTLSFDPGSLVLFRGRNAMHRVTPTEGEVTRLLVVLAYNERAGVRLSDSALATFYGRTS